MSDGNAIKMIIIELIFLICAGIIVFILKTVFDYNGPFEIILIFLGLIVIVSILIYMFKFDKKTSSGLEDSHERRSEDSRGRRPPQERNGPGGGKAREP